jgi:EAL domain-containing protein (putative c-di-GMP-specific phosphodiesterase class I)
LKLEITESVVMENAEAATLMFKQLRALGVQLSIDDFGTGYSSLSYLHRFPLNYLKIDRSFVSRLTTDNDNAIVRTISTLARNLGMEVIAEGIETEEQYQQLKMLGCEYGQGYLFSHPVNSEGVLHLLSQEAHRDAEPESLPLTPAATEDEVVVAYSM